LFAKQVALFAETWEDHERPIHTLNKFCKIYINGFEGAKEMREQFMQAASCKELSTLLQAAH
jgi:tRNA-dihydrouridine synthase